MFVYTPLEYFFSLNMLVPNQPSIPNCKTEMLQGQILQTLNNKEHYNYANDAALGEWF